MEFLRVPASDLRMILEIIELVGEDDPDDYVEITPGFLKAVLEEPLFSEIDGCDHSVGICNCASIAALSHLRLALEGKRPCPVCSGEGRVWDEAHLSDCTSEYHDHYRSCRRCDSSGLADIEVVSVP